MTETVAPAWLVEHQTHWSTLLRGQLDSSTGTFRERRSAYADALKVAIRQAELPGSTTASVEDRLALYHQQYWMRLFTTLQGRYPRFSYALGYWHFNHLAALHLQTSAPCHFDIDRAGDGFAGRVREALRRLTQKTSKNHPWNQRIAASRAPLALLTEALHLDEAERRAFESDLDPLWKPSAADLANLSALWLRTSTSLQLVTETWDLIRHSSLTSATVASTHAPPRKLGLARRWAIHRSEFGVQSLELSPPFAALLEKCLRLPFGAALVELEQECIAEDLALVRTELPVWIQTALSHRIWVGGTTRPQGKRA